MSTQAMPSNDAIVLQHAVHEMHIGNYHHFESDGYLAMYPHQLGLVLFCYVFSFIFGSDNYVVFELFNACCLALFYKELSEIGSRMGLKRTHILAIPILGILFIPLTMYCSSVYGTISGIAFSVTAIRYEIDYFTNKRGRSAVLSAICIFLALLLKKNSLIYLIGMIIYAFLKILQMRETDKAITPKPILIILIYAISATLATQLPITVSSLITGEKIGQGSSSWCWIAMGMQESYRAPGWYNGFVEDAFRDSDNNTELSADRAKSAITERLRYFAGHKREAVMFYTEKAASQWNNPTFQGFWLMQAADTHIRPSNIFYFFLSLEGELASSLYLKTYMLIIYFTALIGTIGLRKYDNIEAYICPTIFIGGAIFHIFVWEAEGMYTIPYFPLLIPIAVIGMDTITSIISGLISVKDSSPVKACLKSGYLWLSLLLCILFILCYSGGHGSYLTADGVSYQDYTNYYIPHKVLPDSTFRLSASEYPSMSLNIISDKGEDVLALSENAMGLSCVYSEGKALLFVRDDQRNNNVRYEYITFPQNSSFSPDESGTSVPLKSIMIAEQSQLWTVHGNSDNGVYILHGNSALTYNRNGDVYVDTFEGRNDQLWTVITGQ